MNNNIINEIDLSNINIQKKITNLSEIATDIDFIKLETQENCFIATPTKTVFCNNYILIWDRKIQKLLLFDNNGIFLRNISKRGKGPGEYNMIDALCMDPENNNIIFSNDDLTINIFDINGNLLNKYKMPATPHNLNIIDKKLIFYSHHPMTLYNNNSAITITSFLGDISKKLLLRKLSWGKRNDLAHNVYNYNYYDTLTFYEPYFDTIYGLSKYLDIRPRWIIRHSETYIGVEGLKQRGISKLLMEGKYYISNFVESKDYFFIEFTNPYKNRIIYDKKNHNKTSVKHKNEIDKIKGGFFNNDLCGGYPFWPYGSINENELYMYVNISDLRKYQLDNQNSSLVESYKFPYMARKFQEIIDESKELDNPIIMIVKLAN